MALIDGLRGGQALLATAPFDSTLQLPDDSNMYKLALLGVKSNPKTKQPKVSNGGEDKLIALPGEHKGLQDMDVILDIKRSSLENKYYSLYKDKYNNNDKEFLASEDFNKLQQELLSLDDAKRQRDAYVDLAKVNLEKYSKFAEDNETRNQIYQATPGMTTAEVSIGGQKKYMNITAEQLAYQKRIENKIGSGIPLDENEINFLNGLSKNTLGEKVQLTNDELLSFGSSIKITPGSVADNLYLQAKHNQPGDKIDPGMYLNESSKKEVINQYSSALEKVGKTLTEKSGFSEAQKGISVLLGGAGYQQSSSYESNVNNLRQYIDGYLMTLRNDTNTNLYWNNEYMQALSNNNLVAVANKNQDGFLEYETDKNGNIIKDDKGHAQLKYDIKPVHDISLEQFVESRLVSQAAGKANIASKTKVDPIRMSDYQLGINQSEKDNWHNNALQNTLQYDWGYGADDKTLYGGKGNPYSSFISSTYKDLATIFGDKGIDIRTVSKDNPGLRLKFAELLIEKVRDNKLQLPVSTSQNIGMFLSSLVPSGSTFIPSANLALNYSIKNKSDLIDAIPSIIDMAMKNEDFKKAVFSRYANMPEEVRVVSEPFKTWKVAATTPAVIFGQEVALNDIGVAEVKYDYTKDAIYSPDFNLFDRKVGNDSSIGGTMIMRTSTGTKGDAEEVAERVKEIIKANNGEARANSKIADNMVKVEKMTENGTDFYVVKSQSIWSSYSQKQIALDKAYAIRYGQPMKYDINTEGQSVPAPKK